ncbi:methionine/alanine import family NSS transporter small subunit [Halalkalibacter alkalisediminis]|uniref:Methionine/alanine import family NSS transporter small subunit n=1 Tax=Halalkalibacter alkalisediminis TaxID=935616 RepID=A0ABV6NH50_9BACI|nr:methionine/alanine import family NSS transporter small subunit [Halalkalibacter alkalisediminis]
MSTSAVVMMIVGMIVIWGGMGLSIANAVKVAKNKK